jgi:hypothetical protein
MGKANVNGDAATFLFTQAVGIDTGERLHQTGFAMIDVPRRAYDDRSHNRSL